MTTTLELAPRHVRALGAARLGCALAAVATTVLFSTSAQAYRPFDLTDADVVKRHNFEFELGPAEFVGVGSEHSLRLPNLGINYGLATGRELVLEGANRLALKAEPGEPRTQVEDVAFGMKQILRRGSLQDEPGVSIGTENAILFPGRGELHLGASSSLILSSEHKRGTVHVNFEAERLPEGRNAGSAGMIFEASDHFGLAPAFELKLEAVHGELPERSLILGLIYVPREEAEYDVALRIARLGDENILELRAGMTWQLSAHTVLEKAASGLGLPPPRRRRH